jgi:hypothetical protein
MHTPVDLVQTLAMVATTKEHEVRPRRLANEGNLCDVRPCTTIRAPSHAHDNRVVSKTILLAYLLYFVNEQG